MPDFENTIPNNKNQNDFLCFSCGLINEKSETLVCSKCKKEIDIEFYSNTITFAKSAVHYGYRYRLTYESHIKNFNEIIPYSILNPTSYEEWLAVAALSGMAGNLAYDIMKYIAKQIILKLTVKKQTQKLNHREQEIFTIISDDSKLNQFLIYIKSYYDGNPNIDIKVKEAILEEESINNSIENRNKRLKIQDNKVDDEDGYSLNNRVISSKNEKDKPKIEELEELLGHLKMEIKSQKKN